MMRTGDMAVFSIKAKDKKSVFITNFGPSQTDIAVFHLGRSPCALRRLCLGRTLRLQDVIRKMLQLSRRMLRPHEG